MVIWITGLSGSGKTTIGKAVYEYIKSKNLNTIFLDGDIIRKALQNNYGYTYDERLKGARQVSGLCKMLDNEGQIVVCCTIGLFEEIQESNRKEIDKYIEVYLDVDMDTLIKRDKKALYTSGIKNVVGIDIPYFIPKTPELSLSNTKIDDLEKNIDSIISYYEKII